METQIKYIAPGVSANQTKCFQCGQVFLFGDDTNEAFERLADHVDEEHLDIWKKLEELGGGDL